MISTVFNGNFLRVLFLVLFSVLYCYLILSRKLSEEREIQVNAMYSLYRIYERVIDPPETNLTPESNLWLGQRNRKHGFFKVSRYEMAREEGK